jgi:release factor glutamine methyltransferase
MLAWMTQDLAALGIPSARLDAELLLAHALGCDRVRLYMDMPRPLQRAELGQVRELVVRRRRREPVAYILGRREFYRREFEIDASVLVPRPETEVLVDRALEALPSAATRALDLCTGSGVIATTLALERPGLTLDASDVSEPALELARRNAARHGVTGRVQFHLGDLFHALPEPRRYDLIVANPPYVAESDFAALAPEITQHEPRVALLAGVRGLDVIARLCAQAADWLVPGGALLFEIGRGQAAEVVELARGARLEQITTQRDLAGIERVVYARARE